MLLKRQTDEVLWIVVVVVTIFAVDMMPFWNFSLKVCFRDSPGFALALREPFSRKFL
jgi:hypothetical protein